MDNKNQQIILLVIGIFVCIYLIYNTTITIHFNTEKLEMEKVMTPCQKSVLALEEFKYANGNPENIINKDMVGYNASFTACKIRTGEH